MRLALSLFLFSFSLLAADTAPVTDSPPAKPTPIPAEIKVEILRIQRDILRAEKMIEQWKSDLQKAAAKIPAPPPGWELRDTDFEWVQVNLAPPVQALTPTPVEDK